jgi:hypothetical protein
MPGQLYVAPQPYAALETPLSSSKLNQLVAALAALKTWIAPGDILYAADPNTLERLPAPSVPSILYMDHSGVPQWLPTSQLLGGLALDQYLYFSQNAWQPSTAGWFNVTSAVQTITLPEGSIYNLDIEAVTCLQIETTQGGTVGMRVVVDGNADPNTNTILIVANSNSGDAVPLPYNYFYGVQNLTAGAHTIQLQIYSSVANTYVYVWTGRMRFQAYSIGG